MFEFFKRDKEPTDEDIKKIMLNISHVNIPLDLMLQLLLRQQNQLFEAIEAIKAIIAANDQIADGLAQNIGHLHEDMVHIQQNIEAATTHPVDKIEAKVEEDKPDEKPEERAARRKRNMIN